MTPVLLKPVRYRLPGDSGWLPRMYNFVKRRLRMTRNIGTNTDLEAAIQNVICAADLASGPIEATITGETASYAFYKLMEEIEALRHAADAVYPAAQAYHAAPACQPAATPDWTGSQHG